MKICYLADARSSHVKKWVEYFAKDNEIDLITFSYTTEEDAFIPESDYIKMGVRVHKISKKMPYLLMAPIFIRRLIHKIQPDVLHAHYATQYGFCAAFSGFHPFAVSTWGNDILIDPFKSDFLKHFIKYSLKKADVITCNGNTLKYGITKLGIERSKIEIIYHGVKTAIFNPNKKDYGFKYEIFDEPDVPVVINIRGFDPIYDLETFIEAIPAILNEVPDTKFIVAGDGEKKEHFISLAKKLQVYDAVRFVGWINHEDLPRYIASSDIYVSTALSDGFAVSTLESLASGLPLVVTDSGDNRYWVHDDINGYIIPFKDSQTLAEKIIYLLKNDEKRFEFGISSREYVEINGDYHNNMGKMESLYAQMVGE